MNATKGKATICANLLVSWLLVLGIAAGLGAGQAYAVTDAGQATVQGSATDSMQAGGQGLMAYSLQPQAGSVSKPAKAKVKAKRLSSNRVLTVKASGSKVAKGYEYKIARNAKFTSGVKTKVLASKRCTFKGLKKGAAYYVKARAYRMSDGKKVWGSWSRAKKLESKRVWKSKWAMFLSGLNGKAKVRFVGNKLIVTSKVGYYNMNGGRYTKSPYKQNVFRLRPNSFIGEYCDGPHRYSSQFRMSRAAFAKAASTKPYGMWAEVQIEVKNGYVKDARLMF